MTSSTTKIQTGIFALATELRMDVEELWTEFVAFIRHKKQNPNGSIASSANSVGASDAFTEVLSSKMVPLPTSSANAHIDDPNGGEEEVTAPFSTETEASAPTTAETTQSKKKGR